MKKLCEENSVRKKRYEWKVKNEWDRNNEFMNGKKERC
jgi:hypothetical protein